jgi:hypothetical protein
MTDTKQKRRGGNVDKRRDYSAPRVLEEQSFEREALALCGKGSGAQCIANGGLTGVS